MLQLIRKPDRDWNYQQLLYAVFVTRYNSLENPIGIETRIVRVLFVDIITLQLIRKPDRDWNSGVPGSLGPAALVTTH